MLKVDQRVDQRCLGLTPQARGLLDTDNGVALNVHVVVVREHPGFRKHSVVLPEHLVDLDRSHEHMGPALTILLDVHGHPVLDVHVGVVGTDSDGVPLDGANLSPARADLEDRSVLIGEHLVAQAADIALSASCVNDAAQLQHVLD